jgi:hypothetical protein
MMLYAAMAGKQPAMVPIDQPPLVALHQEEKAKPEDDSYAKLIAGFKTESGPFTVHTKDETIYFELPDDIFGKDLLWTAEMKETPEGQLYNGTFLGSFVVRFEKRGDRILLRQAQYNNRAVKGGEIGDAVRQSNVDPILYTFDAKAKSKSGAPVIDVSRLFKGDAEFPVGQAVGAGGMDPSRSFLDAVRVFPENVNVQVTVTYRANRQTVVNPFFTLISGPSAGTGVVLHSLVKLPEKPMMGRLADSRVGYFSNAFTEWSMDDQGSKDFAFINRYRLEKKDPTAALSEPVKPIVYYVSREVPEKWRKWCISGVEKWNVAYEAAGFKNAIVCKVAPDDPNWSPEDARYSVLRWAPRPIANAMGPSVTDPRSGEIISAHIILWNDVLKLVTDWYFAQASPLDKRAQQIPFSDELMGELLETVVTHEVGHTLGLPHNGKSSAMVPVENLRDPKWTAENGTAPSIMDYARFNYVAQPGDNASLLMKVGMYDKFSIMWGYKPIEAATTPWDEKPTLDAWASRQVGEPMLRFYDNFNGSDPTAQSEALGDDAMKASDYGVANLKRVMGFLMSATNKFGEDYSLLEREHGAVMDQLSLYVGHVVTNVGGVVQTDYHAGRGSAVYEPVLHDKQMRAVNWVAANILTPPNWLIPNDVMSRLSGESGVNRIAGLQSSALNQLLNNGRINRMLDNEARHGANAYTVREMMATLRGVVWSGLKAESPVFGIQSRTLQKNYVNSLANKLSGNASEARALAMADLKMQAQLIRAALPRVKDEATRAHLDDVLLSIKRAIEMPPAAAGAGGQTVSFPPFISGQSGTFSGCDFLHGLVRD